MEDKLHLAFFNKLCTHITEEEYQVVVAEARATITEGRIKELEEMAREEYGSYLQDLIWEG